MGRMKDYLFDCQELLEAGSYEQLLEKLRPWGEDAPAQLWAVMAWLVAFENPETGYIDYDESGAR